MGSPLFSKLMNIKIDASTIGCATDFNLAINKDTIDIACLSSTGAKQTVPDMYGWTVSGSGLVFKTVGQSGYSIFDMSNKLLTSDASVYVTLIPDVSANQYYGGAGYFTALTYSGGVGAAVKYTFEIKGDGVLSVLTTA